MSSTPSIDALDVKVQNLEKTVDEIKIERRESQKILVDTLKSLQENAVRQTTIMEVMEERAKQQDVRLDKMDEKLDQVNIDVQTIKVRSETMLSEDKNESKSDNSNWLQNLAGNYQKQLWIAFILLLGTALGFKFPDLLSLLKL
jgi:seryl-tRNA synthetase